MGQQLNPVGIRVGIHRKWKSNWFLDQKYYTDFLLLNFEINKYLTGILRNSTITSFLINCYISKISLEKLYICVFFYRLRQDVALKSKKKNKNINYKLFRDKHLNINMKHLNKNCVKTQKMNKIFTILLNVIDNSKCLFKIKKPSNLFNTKFNLLKNKTSISLPSNQIRKIKLKKNKNFKLKQNSYKNLKLIKNSLSELTNSKIYLIMVNSLSFIMFYEYLHEFSTLYKYNKQAEYERLNLSRQMISFYRYDVKLINDSINVIFITLILKQPQFLAQFIGYQLRKTPRNYRLNKIIQFLNQTITSVVKNRKEILGCRIQFKGRLGGRRSRRARKMQFINEGIMPLHTYTSKIEYGEAQGITKFGVVGIKVWLCYESNFNHTLQKDLLIYFGYKLKHKRNKKNNHVTTKKKKIQKIQKRTFKK